MALHSVRPKRLPTFRISTLSLVSQKHASSTAALVDLSPADTEQTTHTNTTQRPDVSVRPSRRPKVEEYLQYVAQNSALTLEDLESFRPKSHSPIGSMQYESQYQALLEKLDRSFTASQLRHFLNLYGIQVSSKIRKRAASATIVEKQWGWPSLAKSQRLARATKEKSSRVFQLNPQQAFLLLGKDGTEILSLSQTYNVRLQFSRKPLSLTVSGTMASVERLERHVETLKEEITWQDFDPPRQFDLSSCSQYLSRSSGCFLEGLLDGKIRIWHRKSTKDSTSLAKRLIMQHAIKDVGVPLAACPSSSDNRTINRDLVPIYALYPFFCQSTRSPGNKGSFRLRRVGKWFVKEDQALSNSDNGVTYDYIAMAGGYANAREQLLAQVEPSGQVHTFSIIAIPGHVVLNSRGSSGFSLAPPLEGRKNVKDVMNWIQEHKPSVEFIHGAPMRFWQAPPGSDQQWRRRLVYETVPIFTEQAQILICEYTPNNKLGNVAMEAQTTPLEVGSIPKSVLRGGPVARLHVLMPDGARDLQLTLAGDENFIESWPTELSDMVTSSIVSDAPLMFEYEKKQYILKEDFFVQSKSFSVNSENVPVNIINERRFDPQTSESYLSYHVHCSDISSDTAWNVFWENAEKVAQDSSTPLPDEASYQTS